MPEPTATPWPKKLPVIFVVGMGRSGTTLLTQLLHSHSQISAPFESKFLMHLQSKYGKRKTWQVKHREHYLKDLQTDRKLRLYWNIDFTLLDQQLAALGEQTTYQEYYRQTMLAYDVSKAQHTTLLIDKNPFHTQFIDQLLKLFPEARFIHMVRDPRAAISSSKKINTQRSYPLLAEIWRTSNLRVEQYKKQHQQRFFTLKYEDLVGAPEEQLKRFCTWAAIAFEPAMLEHTRSNTHAGQLAAIEQHSHHKAVGQPINKDALDKWKKDLPTADQKNIEAITVEAAKKYGYVFNATPTVAKKARKKLAVMRRMLRTFYLLPFGVRASIFRKHRKREAEKKGLQPE